MATARRRWRRTGHRPVRLLPEGPRQSRAGRQPDPLFCLAPQGFFKRPSLRAGRWALTPPFHPYPATLSGKPGGMVFCDTIRHLPAWAGKCPPFRTACCLMVFGLSSAGKGAFPQRPPATSQDRSKCVGCKQNATSATSGKMPQMEDSDGYRVAESRHRES